MNILILSCGTRNKVVEYFKRELSGKGKVIAADCSGMAPALYAADRHYLVPPITGAGYVGEVIEICEKEHVDALFSLIDPELAVLSENKEKFLEKGITPIVSDSDAVGICFDKYKMFQFCRSNGIPTVLTYESFSSFLEGHGKGEVGLPVFVKPRCGSCSVEAQLVGSMEKLGLLCRQNPGLIIQEYMEGTELGADVYVDLLSREPVSIFTKRKLLMRAGETDKSVSVKDGRLFALVEAWVRRLGLLGPVDMDIFKKGEHYFISEVNPRFGGGYPHAYECGVNFPKYMINNMNGTENKRAIGNYEEEIYMMKYLDVKIVSGVRGNR